MVVSASDRSRAENALVACVRLACRLAVSCCVTWFQVFQTGVALQNLPATVSSVVRVVLESRPRLFTSLSAVAYVALLTGGGGAGRNCGASRRRNGVPDPQPVYIGAGNLGGVCRWSKGRVPGTNGGAAAD